MQTFITYKPIPELLDPFIHTARSLDYRRLGKQRVEAKQIMFALGVEDSEERGRGWVNHPATKMWRGYEDTLRIYAIDICKEWIRRGYKDTLLPWFEDQKLRVEYLAAKRRAILNEDNTPFPSWLVGEAGDAFVTAHRSNLIRKDPEYYGPKFPGTPSDLPYVWPR